MEISEAVGTLGALAQECRLKVFRLLVRCGAEGISAGAIADELGVPHNTLSTHLGILARAKLVNGRKEGRSVIYTVDLAGTRELLSFLVEDCCRGQPQLCGPLIVSAPQECCGA